MNLTVEQIENMMHALGISPQEKKLRMYRNRYVEDDNKSWNDLVDKGLATKGTGLGMNYYSVSEVGISLVKRLSGALTEEEYDKANVGVKPYKYEHENGTQLWLFCCQAEPHVLEEDDINNTFFCKYCGTKIDWSDEE